MKKGNRVIDDEYYGAISRDATHHYLLRRKLEDMRSINLQILALAGISLFALLLVILNTLM